MSKFSRAYRRRQRARIIAKCIDQLFGRDYDRSWVDWWARRRVNTRVSCSCSTCGTPRRHHGNSAEALTRQERRMANWQKEID